MLLFVAQLVLSGFCGVMAMLSTVWLIMPICSDNCDSPDVTHFVHRTFTGAVVVGGGAALGLLVSIVGALVTGLRHNAGMWKWPAIGLAIVTASALITLGLWVN